MRAGAVAALLLLALAGCGGGGDDAAAPGAAASATQSVDPAALYADFAECDPLPTQQPHEPVEGLVALEGSWIEDVSETGPLVSVRGLVDATPLEIRDEFAERDDVELVYVEDEGYEVELLVDQGDTRTFLKATIRCRTGSVFAQIIGPAGEAEMLPVPGQQQGG